MLTPEEAWNIDTKLDDGKPGRGRILTYKGSGSNNPVVPWMAIPIRIITFLIRRLPVPFISYYVDMWDFLIIGAACALSPTLFP